MSSKIAFFWQSGDLVRALGADKREKRPIMGKGRSVDVLIKGFG